MNILKRVYHLLQEEERKKLMKMAVTVFFSALLNLIGLAVLLPLLYFLLEENDYEKVIKLINN